MISILDIQAYALKISFNLIGSFGGPLLNLGLTRDLDVFPNLRYGAGPEQCLDILRPKIVKPGGLPILVFFHGGGWISADKKIYRGIAAAFSHHGFLTFNVDYRLAPNSRFPAPLQDAAHALDWIERNAARYGGDRSVIVLAGDSAGAQIASWYASALRNHSLFRQIGIQGSVNKASVKGLLLFYGVYDFDAVLDAPFPFIRIYARSFLGTDLEAYAHNARLASPIQQAAPDLPPVWLCVGEKDGLYTQSKAYADVLKSRGVRCRTLFFSRACRAHHGFLFFRWLKSTKAAVLAAVEFARDLTSNS